MADSAHSPSWNSNLISQPAQQPFSDSRTLEVWSRAKNLDII